MRLSSSVALALLLSLGPATGAAQSRRIDVSEMPRPIEAADNVWIEELTMLEVRDALREGRTTALILTGGIEENGPYSTTGKHNHVLRVMGEAIARELGDALVAPIVTLEPGDPENARSPGTVYLSRGTYVGVLRDMAISLKAQGFRDIALMGDSGGNQAPMREVAQALSSEWRSGPARIHFIPEYYNYDDVLTYQSEVLGVDEDPYLDGLHDHYYITSIVMNADPKHARLEQRIAAQEASINGFSIVPVEKTIAHGRKLIDFRTEATVTAIRDAITEAR